MSSLNLALRYMEIFFSGADPGELRPLLADDLRFEGPFYRFDTADAYLRSLEADPPEDFSYQILETFENQSAACVVFRFSKPGVSVPMAQTFRVERGKIVDILLIFDGRAFL